MKKKSKKWCISKFDIRIKIFTTTWNFSNEHVGCKESLTDCLRERKGIGQGQNICYGAKLQKS